MKYFEGENDSRSIVRKKLKRAPTIPGQGIRYKYPLYEEYDVDVQVDEDDSVQYNKEVTTTQSL